MLPACLRPAFLQRLASDEFTAPRYTSRDRRALARLGEVGPRAARRAGLPLPLWTTGRRGTAAGLLALNAAAGRDFYAVPPEAGEDAEAAEAAFAGDETVIDVQTHFVGDRPQCERWDRELGSLYRAVAPEWWRGFDGLGPYRLAEYLRCVFLESETAHAVLTSAPGLGPDRMLWNDELAGTRDWLARLGAEGRLQSHCVVHPNADGEIEAMGTLREACDPAGWKVYTLPGQTGRGDRGWWLDDEATGRPFLERARDLGVRRICAHKGISQLVPTGSPRDVGPAAAAFPELDFLIYHSGYEMPSGEAPEEGPYDAGDDRGVNRLVTSLRAAGLGPGANVYAELGSTWFCLIRRPEEAAHVLGKLLRAVGEDNVLWGTDAIWYGPSQPAIDAFRAFRIPPDFQQRWGYPELTPGLRAKILGANAARVYGLDLAAVRLRAASDDLAWVRQAVAEHRERGLPGAP